MQCDAGFLPGNPPRWSLTSSAALFVNRFGNCGLGRPQKTSYRCGWIIVFSPIRHWGHYWRIHPPKLKNRLKRLSESISVQVILYHPELGSQKRSTGWWFQPIWKNIRQNGFNLPQLGNWRWFHPCLSLISRIRWARVGWAEAAMNGWSRFKKRSCLIQRFESTTYKWCIYGCNLQTEVWKEKKTEPCKVRNREHGEKTGGNRKCRKASVYFCLNLGEMSAHHCWWLSNPAMQLIEAPNWWTAGLVVEPPSIGNNGSRGHLG